MIHINKFEGFCKKYNSNFYRAIAGYVGDLWKIAQKELVSIKYLLSYNINPFFNKKKNCCLFNKIALIFIFKEDPIVSDP